MRYLILLGVVATAGIVRAQPLSPTTITDDHGHYIFTVVEPASVAETLLWAFGKLELTTHRVKDRRDSSSIDFRPLPHPHLRTFFTSAKLEGADAGAAEVITAGEAAVEVLHYPALLSPEQRQLTESYLAIKHGLTLNQRVPTNYLRSVAGGSQPVWTATHQPQYRHRIIGLAQDPASRLLRREGHSALAPKTLSLHWEALPDSTAYLLLADNGAPTARTAGSRQLQRSWRVETTGAVPTTRLRLDTRQFFDRAKPGEAWQLEVRLADGTSLAYRAIATTDASLTFSGVQFPPDGVATIFLVAASAATPPEGDPLFTSFTLSPNPVQAGQLVQLRAATGRTTRLVLSVYDPNGRLVESRALPPSTHHLTEVSFPVPGTYTLHLRPRQTSRQAPTASLQIVVQ